MDGLVVKLAETEWERHAAMGIRRRVFVEEQGVPLDEEVDGLDEVATHALALVDGGPVGTARVVYLPLPAGGEFPIPHEACVGRMAVDREWRLRGIASSILSALEREARRRGATTASLHAQAYVKAFYAARGYVEKGELFLEAGIEHVTMAKRL